MAFVREGRERRKGKRKEKEQARSDSPHGTPIHLIKPDPVAIAIAPTRSEFRSINSDEGMSLARVAPLFSLSFFFAPFASLADKISFSFTMEFIQLLA